MSSQFNRVVSLLMIFLFGAMVSAATAVVKIDEPKPERVINARAGEKDVEHRLSERFNVTESQIAALRADGLGYGEIVILYSLSQKLEGGISENNTHKILEMRKTMGWGRIAKEFGFKLGHLMGRSEKIEHGARLHGEMDVDAKAKTDRSDVEARERSAVGVSVQPDRSERGLLHRNDR